MEVSSLYFSKDVTAIRSICRLPDPDELLQSTHQLAYCLALLQDDVQDDELPPEAIKWRRCAWEEKDYLETMAAQIIRNFATDTLKDSATVNEVVQLVPVLDRDNLRVLLTAFVDTFNQSETLHLPSLDGLTKVIQGAAPGFIDSDDLVTILQSLHKRFQYPFPTTRHCYHLMLAISRVLDAMADTNVNDVDRKTLHEPLTNLLRGFESSKDPYLAYQAKYASQALLCVPDNESIWRPVERRIGFLKDTFKVIMSRENLEFTAKNGFTKKRVWYYALRGAELYIQSGELVRFNEIVTKAPCRHELMFQWGICQILGLFVADTRWDLEARKEAMVFLGALFRDTSLWDRQRGVDQVIFDVVTNVTTNNDTHFEAAWSLLEEIRKQTPALRAIADPQSPLWDNNCAVDPVGDTLAKVRLLNAAQDRYPWLPILHGIHSALRTYHTTDLVLYNASGQELDLETCFVNLSTTEAPAHQHQQRLDLKAKATVFHRIPKFERVENTNTESLIPLEQLFSKRKLRHGHEGVPGRILVQGRAGIGKTTLCKKIVHAYQQGLWRDLFDVVLWIPLRHLRGCKSHTLEGFFREKVFTTQRLDQGQEELATALANRAENGKVLFILDGLDETGEDTEDEGWRVFWTLLSNLIAQRNVLITTRPSGLSCKELHSIHLELEAVGFSQQNVKDLLVKELGSDAAKAAQDFIRQTPWMQGLVNIPLYLDMVCYYWSSLREVTSITMTGFYRLMMRNVWRNGALQTQKTTDGKNLEDIDETMAIELRRLGHIAFKRMRKNHQIEFDRDSPLRALEDLDAETADTHQTESPQLHAFRQVWHFFHLTFQEYCLATWIVHHFSFEQPWFSTGMIPKDPMAALIRQHKYNPQYEMLWPTVAGLLEGGQLRRFFELLQGEPLDLIGGRHQLILASCLNEARDRLDSTIVMDLDVKLKEWLRFEIQVSQHDDLSGSMLGCQFSFPEVHLFEILGPVSSWKPALFNTLASRSALSDFAIHFLINALTDDDWKIRSSSASALRKQFMLPESAIQSLIAALEHDDRRGSPLAAWVLGAQSTLSEFAIQSLAASLKGDDWRVGSLAAYTLGRQSTLPESAVHSLTSALENEDKRVRSLAGSVLGKECAESFIQLPAAALIDQKGKVVSAWSEQSTLPDSDLESLISGLQDKYEDVRSAAASALGEHSWLPEMAIEPLVAALKDDSWSVRFSAVSALDRQSWLPKSAIQSLSDTLMDSNKLVRSSAAWTLSRQSEFSESVMQRLILALGVDDKDVRLSIVVILGQQSTLPMVAIWSLVDAFKDEDPEFRRSVSEALWDHCDSVCTALPNLTKEEMTSLYENHFFRYSCSCVFSFHVDDGKLWIFTEKGVQFLETTGTDLEETITSAIRDVQLKAGLHARKILQVPVAVSSITTLAEE